MSKYSWDEKDSTFTWFSSLYNPFKVPNPQNVQTHSNNSPATADELFEYVWPFCGVCV